MADALDLLLVHQLGNALQQGLLVDLVRQFVDDDGLALPLVDVFKVAARAHHHATTTGAIAFPDAAHAVDDAGSGEVGGRDDLHQLIDGGFRVAQQVQTAVDHLIEVMRRNVGGHAHRNAARAVDQQVGQATRQHQRFFFGAVVVGAEVHRFLVDIAQHFVGDLGQPDLGVPHGGGTVAVDGAEVALAVYQHVAHGEVLRHADDGVVHRLVAVRVVFADHVADDTGRLLVGAVPVVVEFVHCEQNPPVHRLEAIPRIGQGAAHDHAHGVVKVAAPHLLFKADGQGFFGELGHGTVELFWDGQSSILSGTFCRFIATNLPVLTL